MIPSFELNAKIACLRLSYTSAPVEKKRGSRILCGFF